MDIERKQRIDGVSVKVQKQNGKDRLVCFVPRATTDSSFRKWATKTNGFRDLMEFMSNGKRDPKTNDFVAATHISTYLLQTTAWNRLLVWQRRKQRWLDLKE